MSIRILIVDDEEQYLQSIAQKVRSGLQANPWDAPVEVEMLHSDLYSSHNELREKISELSSDRWDAILVDVNLFGSTPKDLAGLLLPLSLVDTFRERNSSAIAIIFSGNIQDHLRDLFAAQASAKIRIKSQIERHIRKIIQLGIVDFSQKNQVADDVIGHLLAPPLLLRLEREFLRTPNLLVESSTLSRLGITISQGSFTFKQVADILRQPGSAGETIAKTIGELGVAHLANLYS